MKKIISFMILTILTLIIFQTNTYAASLSLSTSKSSVTVGDTVTVTVSFGTKVAAADVKLTYDSSKFTYKSVSAGTASNSGSTVTVSYYDTTGGSSPISSMTFTFTSKATGSGTFSASCSSAADSDVNSVTISGSPSKSVTVNAKTTTSSSSSSSTKKTTTTTTTKTEETKSNNTYLSSIEIENFSLTPTFDKDTVQYYLSVNQDVDSLNITATTEDSKASVALSGNTDLQFGTNTVTIKVTAEDGTNKEYLIDVTKADTTLGLSSLIIRHNGEEIDFSPDFDKGTSNYTLNVENASELDIEASANYEDAYITITGNENLKNGENTIYITVQKDEETREYTLTVMNDAPGLLDNIKSFLKNTWVLLTVCICSLLQSAIAIIFAILAYKNSKSES